MQALQPASLATTAQASERTIDRIQILFVAVFAFWSLVPARTLPWVELGELRISYNDLLLVVGALLGLILTRWKDTAVSNSAKRTKNFPLAFFLLLLYALTSLIWSQVNGIDAIAMTWTLVTTASAATLAYCLVYSNSPAVSEKRLWLLTVALALVSAIYFAESFFSLGLRSAENTAWTDFGIQRLRGPLYGSTIGQFILFPALGQSVDQLVNQRKRKGLSALMVLFFCMCIFALGSRSVVFGFAVFAIVAVSKLRTKGKIIFLTIAPVVVLLAGGFVFSRASSDRMVSMTDLGRAMTYETAFTMIKMVEPVEKIFGSGYGGRWPWYLVDVTPGALEGELYFNDTPYGSTLYHPHSTVLLVAVELGIVGVLFGAAVFWWFFRFVNSNLRRGVLPFLNIGLVASLIICCLDLLIFKAPQVNTVWWIYACGAAAMTGTRNKKSVARQ